MDNMERYNLKAWTKNEIRRHKDFIKAIDDEGRYIRLTSDSPDKNVDYYLDDFIADDERDALMAQLKVYLDENIKRFEKYLERLENEESDDLQGRDEGHD